MNRERENDEPHENISVACDVVDASCGCAMQNGNCIGIITLKHAANSFGTRGARRRRRRRRRCHFGSHISYFAVDTIPSFARSLTHLPSRSNNNNNRHVLALIERVDLQSSSSGVIAL